MQTVKQAVNKKTLDLMLKVRGNIRVLIKFLPILSFIMPFFILYSLDPSSFEATWKGRTFYLFFLWLVSLELILDWEKIQTNKLGYLRTSLFIIALLLPTIYVVAANYFGLNNVIWDLAERNKVFWAYVTPLSTEYLVFSVLFTLIILLAHGINGLTNYSISVIFLGVIGLIYTIDNIYPYGRFTPFQFLVPTTATLAASVLNLMGYVTSLGFIENNPMLGFVPYLEVSNLQGKTVGFGIAWPCSGIESLIIYAVAIMLFLKRTDISWKYKMLCFIIGAMVTYLINIARIVTIFLIALDYGVNSPQVTWFHNYYGPLYSITWIISYPLIIIGIRALWRKVTNREKV